MGKKVMILVPTFELLPNWHELVPPPKMGNLKDPAKIAAKQAEWEAKAVETAQDTALASRVKTIQTLNCETGEKLKYEFNTGESVWEALPSEEGWTLVAWHPHKIVRTAVLQSLREGVRIPTRYFMSKHPDEFYRLVSLHLALMSGETSNISEDDFISKYLPGVNDLDKLYDLAFGE